MQEVDAERRIHLLRGIKPEVIPTTSTPTEQVAERDEAPHKRERKRRRRAGEDDTDRDIRLAREDQAVVPVKAELQVKSSKTSDAPLMDRRGHIDLFPMDGSRHSAPKNAEVEAEKAKKKKEFEDQYTMRFSNAAGFKQSIGEKPWYHSSGIIQDKTLEVPSKDVWGNEDPRRKEREKLKVAADDPMAMMQRGVSQLRQVEKERKEWREERDRETRDLDSLRIRRRQRSHRKHEEEELECFSLDKAAVESRHRHRHRHRHQSRSRGRNREGSKRLHHHDQEHGKLDRLTSILGSGRDAGPFSDYSSQRTHIMS